MVSVRKDGWAQRGGIDRVLVLGSGKTLQVDEKVRSKDYDDILLEYWSDVGRQSLGWVAKDLSCDFIAYAFVPSQRCFLLPFPILRRAWHSFGKEWIRCGEQGLHGFRKVEADNGNYTTVSVAVPVDLLMSALSDSMIVTWE